MKQRKGRRINTKEEKIKEKNEDKEFSNLYTSWYSNVISKGEGLTVVFQEQGEVTYCISSGVLVIVESFALIQDVLPRLDRV